MAEIGIVLVGPKACALAPRIGADIPTIHVRPDAIVPMPEDLPSMVRYAADATFHGADADRWQVLAPEELEERTSVLWACAQVQASGLLQATSSWDKVLIVGWLDEPALPPAVRGVVERERPTTVLLGGNEPDLEPRLAQANRVVLAELVRRDQLTTVICNPVPEEVLDVALDAARAPDPIRVARSRPVDVGPALELPSTWVMPAPPVHFFRLVHVPMGHAQRLPELAVYVAAYKALRDLLSGPPVDVEGARFLSPQEVRARLPPDSVAAELRHRVEEALGRVAFRGTRPLVDAIERALRPVFDEVEGTLAAIADVERLRMQHLRAFTAVGIEYTVQALGSRLDGIRDPYPVEHLERLTALMSGEADVGEAGEVHLTAWRRTFAGLSCQVAPRGTAGWVVARQMVSERFGLFRSEFAASLSRSVETLLKRARDPDASPSGDELRALRDRAERVRESLVDLQDKLWERILEECDLAVRDDRIVRWVAPEGADLARLMVARISSLPEAGELDRLTTQVLTRRPLGMADDRDLERYLQELSRDAHGLVSQITELPSYETVLLLLLQGRDPPVLRQALAKSQGTEVELHLERPVEPALMNWLTATGMLVVVAPRLKTCAIYWQRLERMTHEEGQRGRDGATEHRLGDLLLPLPEGDTVGSLVALSQAAAYLLVGLAVGVLRVRRRDGMAVHEIVAPRVGLKGGLLLPHGAVHALAADPDGLARLRTRVHGALAGLAQRSDAHDIVQKLMELSHLGASPSLAAQIGLLGTRFEHLEHPIHALLQRAAHAGVASMMDALHTSELEQLVRLPRRRSLVDVAQLSSAGMA